MDQERENITEQLYNIHSSNISQYLQAKLAETLQSDTIEEIVEGLLSIWRLQFIETISLTILEVKNENRYLSKQLQHDTEYYKHEIAEYQNQLMKVHEEKQILIQKLAFCEKKEESLAELLGNSDFSQKINNLLKIEKENTQEKQKIKKCEEWINKLSSQLEECQQTIILYCNNIQERKDENQETKKQNQRLKTQLQNINKINISLSQRIIQSEKEYEDLFSLSGEKAKTISSYEIILKKKDEQILEKNSVLQEKLSQIFYKENQLSSKIIDHGKMQGNITLLKEQNCFLRETIQKWQKNMALLKEENETLFNKLHQKYDETHTEGIKCQEKLFEIEECLKQREGQYEEKSQKLLIQNQELQQQISEILAQNDHLKIQIQQILIEKDKQKDLLQSYFDIENQKLEDNYKQTLKKKEQIIMNLEQEKMLKNSAFEEKQKIILRQNQELISQKRKLDEKTQQLSDMKIQLQRVLQKMQYSKKFKNKSKFYYLLFQVKEQLNQMKKDLFYFKSKVEKQVSFLVQYLVKSFMNFQIKVSETKAECELCEHEERFQQKEKQIKENGRINKCKFNKRQIQQLRAKYEKITQKNVVMLSKMRY